MELRYDWSTMDLNFAATNQVVDLWNRTLSQEFPLSPHLLEQNTFGKNDHLQSDILLCWEEGEIIGFAITKYNESFLGRGSTNGSKGWISSLIVDKDHHKSGVGSGLLKYSEEHLIKRGVRIIFLGGDINHFFPGVPFDFNNAVRFFGMRGYTYLPSVYDLVITGKELFKFATYFSKNKIGEIITECEEGDLDPFLDFVRKNFPHRWYENLIRYCNSGGNYRNLILLKMDQEIIGFCHIHPKLEMLISPTLYWKDALYKGKVAGLGPMGIDKKYRGYGLGRELLWTSLSLLAKKPIKAVILDWAPQHLMRSLYKEAGFNIWKTYNPAVKFTFPIGKLLALCASKLAFGFQLYRGINLKHLKRMINSLTS